MPEAEDTALEREDAAPETEAGPLRGAHTVPAGHGITVESNPSQPSVGPSGLAGPLRGAHAAPAGRSGTFESPALLLLDGPGSQPSLASQPSPTSRLSPAIKARRARRHAPLRHRLRDDRAVEAHHGHKPSERPQEVPHGHTLRERARSPARASYPAPWALGLRINRSSHRYATLRPPHNQGTEGGGVPAPSITWRLSNAPKDPAPTRSSFHGPSTDWRTTSNLPTTPAPKCRQPPSRKASATFQGDDPKHVRSTSRSKRASHATPSGTGLLPPPLPAIHRYGHTGTQYRHRTRYKSESRCDRSP